MWQVTSDRSQEHFDSVDFGFEWTADGWYRWDMKAGAKAAMKARNARARELRAAGYTVRCSAMDGLYSKGGIGSGKPHIELHGKSYRIDAYR